MEVKTSWYLRLQQLKECILPIKLTRVCSLRRSQQPLSRQLLIAHWDQIKTLKRRWLKWNWKKKKSVQPSTTNWTRPTFWMIQCVWPKNPDPFLCTRRMEIQVVRSTSKSTFLKKKSSLKVWSKCAKNLRKKCAGKMHPPWSARWNDWTESRKTTMEGLHVNINRRSSNNFNRNRTRAAEWCRKRRRGWTRAWMIRSG